MKKLFEVGWLATLLAAFLTVMAPVPAAYACESGVFSVGGVGDGNAATLSATGAAPIYYGGELNNVRQPMNQLNERVRGYLDNCGSNVYLFGFSQGSAIIHAWITENPDVAWQVSAVLWADPKQLGMGVAGSWEAGWTGYPLAGTDDYFNGANVTQLCWWGDNICHKDVGWYGYIFENAHNTHYNFGDSWGWMGAGGFYWV